MSHCLSTNICLPFKRRPGRDASHATNTDTRLWRAQNQASCDGVVAHDEFQVEDCRPASTTSIHILDDDSLLLIFWFYRPVSQEEDEGDITGILKGREWSRERWWYKLAHVCQRWRSLMLASTSYLGLRLVCTHGTLVADMLAHSPPLPLIVDYVDEDRGLNAEDEEGIRHALQHRNRLRRIRLWVPNGPNSLLRKLVVALDGEFPALEYLFLGLRQKLNTGSGLSLRDTFQAPRLRYLMLIHFPFPVASPSLTTAVGLVTLSLKCLPHLYPYDLLGRLLLMPHLVTLEITFHFHLSTHDSEMQQSHTPPLIHVTLANLRWFGFKGPSVYLESLLPGMTTPLLEKLQITFFSQRIFSVTCLLQYISKTDNLNFSSAKFSFTSREVAVSGHPREDARMCVFRIHILCGRLDWQVSSMAQIFSVLSPVSSAVLDLALDCVGHTFPLQIHGNAGNTAWRNLLRSFNHVRTLRVHGSLVGALSHSLRWNEEPLLPELKEVICSGGDHAGEALIALARNVAGQAIHPAHGDFSESPPTSTRESRRMRLGRFSRLWS